MVKILFRIFFILSIFFFICDVHSQNLDSLSVIDSKYDSILRSDGESMRTLFYKHKNDVLINNLGSFGSVFYYPTAFYFQKNELIKKEDSFKNKIHQLTGIRPYTNITYINASRKEQHFSIKHIQQFGKLLFLDFDFLKISSPGAYNNQEANNTTFTGSLVYDSKKGNYDVKYSTGIYRNFYEENGGLFDVKEYENKLFDDERTYQVNLSSSNSFVKKFHNQLEQRLDLFKLKSDSVTKNKVYLKHRISYSTQQKVFFDNDPLSTIYNDVFIDTISSIDSIYTNNFSNTGGIGYRTNTFFIDFFGQYDQKEYEQSIGIKSSYHNTYIGFSGSLKKKGLNIDVLSRYGIDGYRSGDVESALTFSYDKTKYVLNGGISYLLTEPDLKFINYTSNHFIWNNSSFEKQAIVGFDIGFELKKLQLEFKVASKLLNKTLYYDSLAIADQDENTASITTFLLAKNYKLLNFYFRTAFIYQITSDETLFPLPEMVGRQVLYYQKYIFKGALKFQFGLGFSYSTEYLGYAYMPAINEFYVQEHTKIGYYPKIDVFINTHLKRAQIFLKYEHINAGGSLPKSYVAPGYPPLAKSLKFGVSWNMFD